MDIQGCVFFCTDVLLGSDRVMKMNSIYMDFGLLACYRFVWSMIQGLKTTCFLDMWHVTGVFEGAKRWRTCKNGLATETSCWIMQYMGNFSEIKTICIHLLPESAKIHSKKIEFTICWLRFAYASRVWKLQTEWCNQLGLFIYGYFQKMGIPKLDGSWWKTLLKWMDDLGVPLFLETPIYCKLL